jgi:hypothetical protein
LLVFPRAWENVHPPGEQSGGLRRTNRVQILRMTTAAATAGTLALFSADAASQGWEPVSDPKQEPVPEQPTAQPEAQPPAVVPGVGESVEWELAGRAAYVTGPIRGGTDPFGAGIGARAGLTWGTGWYLGGTFTYFLGGRDVDVSYRAILYGLEFGYGFRFRTFGASSLTLRPKIGVGDAAVYYTDPSLAADVVTSASGSSGASDTLTVNNLYLQPGLTAMLEAGGHFVAVDASALVLPGIAYGGADATTWVSYGVQAELGFRF